MNSPLQVGLFGAWAAVQMALGAFFLQAFYARRREQEYLLFSLVCFAYGVADAGYAMAAAAESLSDWSRAARVVHAGLFAGSALTVHFTLGFVAPERAARVTTPVYVVALVLAVSVGWFWEAGSLVVRESHVLGFRMTQMEARFTAMGMLAYAAALLSAVWCLALLGSAYRAGRKEARGAIIGLTVAVVTGAVDTLSVGGALFAPTLLPYGCLIYGFGVTDTLLVRYRHAADNLETTANELRRATDELTNSYLELSVVQEELFKKKQLASVGELAASIAHEVRNPLAVIVNAAANLKRTNLGADDRSTLFEIISEEITRLNGLVTELVRFARPMNVRREDVSLAEVWRTVTGRLDEKYAIDLHMDDDPDVRTLWADPALLTLALTNMVDNACQAMPEGGSIVGMATRARLDDQPAVWVELKDTGPGMDPTTARRALDPFFSTRPRGTGLGLPIALRIAEAHGGTLDLRTSPGEGTTVGILFPMKRGEKMSDPRLSEKPRA